jgi:hypothetical protein
MTKRPDRGNWGLIRTATALIRGTQGEHMDMVGPHRSRGQFTRRHQLLVLAPLLAGGLLLAALPSSAAPRSFAAAASAGAAPQRAWQPPAAGTHCHVLPARRLSRVYTTLAQRLTPAALDATLARRYCLVPTTPPTATPTTSATSATSATSHERTSPAKNSVREDLNVPAPKIDRVDGPFPHGEHEYVAIGKWKWRDSAYANDTGKGAVNEPANIGGDDGFAIRLDSGMEMLNYGLTICGNGHSYGCRSFSRTDDSSTFGAGFEEQDTLDFSEDVLNQPPTYNADDTMFSGTESVYFRARNKCIKSVQAWSRYAHTWSSTAVDSIDIGKDSIGFGWHSEGHDWKIGSHPSNAVKVCH